MTLHEIKIGLMQRRIDRRWLADDLSVSYSSLNMYLNGFTRMPDRVYNRIVWLFNENSAALRTQIETFSGRPR